MRVQVVDGHREILIGLHQPRTAGHDSAQGESLDPNLSTRQPEPNFNPGAVFHCVSRFHQATTNAGIAKIAPDRSFRAVNPQLDCDEAANTGMLPAIVY